MDVCSELLEDFSSGCVHVQWKCNLFGEIEDLVVVINWNSGSLTDVSIM